MWTIIDMLGQVFHEPPLSRGVFETAMTAQAKAIKPGHSEIMAALPDLKQSIPRAPTGNAGTTPREVPPLGDDQSTEQWRAGFGNPRSLPTR